MGIPRVDQPVSRRKGYLVTSPLGLTGEPLGVPHQLWETLVYNNQSAVNLKGTTIQNTYRSINQIKEISDTC